MPGGLVADAQTIHRSRSETLNVDVGPSNEPSGYFQSRRDFHVHRQAQLGGIEFPKELGAVWSRSAIFEWSDGAQDIQRRGRFYPNYRRAVGRLVLDRRGTDDHPRDGYNYKYLNINSAGK